ncbi:hypothetical protein AKJ36_00510 [candidate division MSBL1 archaeon SCGC-AAA259I07]|uniref:Uncharacterized protein n=1 Tax=candidate division MSBL1 archaeon SCGC-AAA259I07 TaxID=1698266 RepID=A0A133UMK6_9EURY|nr:hypothetical protein AKJ36_00510 [candidate division MSBL1 archaeon SCGC-AAA259I07]
METDEDKKTEKEYWCWDCRKSGLSDAERVECKLRGHDVREIGKKGSLDWETKNIQGPGQLRNPVI